jgi:hypothetical protein
MRVSHYHTGLNRRWHCSPRGLGLALARVLARLRRAEGVLDHRCARELPLGYAHGHAMDFVRRLGPGTQALIDPRARWRQHPVSAGQLDAGRRCGVPIHPGLTKGEAADLLTAAFARARR